MVAVTNEDARFIVGKKGTCKRKVELAAGVTVDVDDKNLVVRVYGRPENRRRAVKYIRLLKGQRVKRVDVDLAQDDDGDLTVVDVPREAIGFVTGQQGKNLRNIEAEWNTLMFFLQGQDGTWGSEGSEGKLAVFGDLRGRTGAQLHVMSCIEQKLHSRVTEGIRETVCADEWGTDVVDIRDDFKYALGHKGTTRKKLARAAGCILQYIGTYAFIAGTRAERRRGRDYLGWLCRQAHGPVTVPDADRRDDVDTLRVPKMCVGYITGESGQCTERRYGY